MIDSPSFYFNLCTDRIRSLLPGWTFDIESDGGPPSYDVVSSSTHTADVHPAVGGQPEQNRGRRGRKQAASATLDVPSDAQVPPVYRGEYPRPNQRRDDLDGDLYPGSRSSNNSAAADSGYCGPETERYSDRYQNAHVDSRDEASYDNQAYINGSQDNIQADEKPSQYAARAMQYTDNRNSKPEKPSRKNRSAPMDYAMQDRTDLNIQSDSRYGADTRYDEHDDKRHANHRHQGRYDDDRNVRYDDTRYSHDDQRDRYDQDHRYKSQGVRNEQDYTRTHTPEISHRDQKNIESNDVDFQRRKQGYQFGSDEKKDNSISFTSGQYVMKDTGMNESFI